LEAEDDSNRTFDSTSAVQRRQHSWQLLLSPRLTDVWEDTALVKANKFISMNITPPPDYACRPFSASPVKSANSMAGGPLESRITIHLAIITLRGGNSRLPLDYRFKAAFVLSILVVVFLLFLLGTYTSRLFSLKYRILLTPLNFPSEKLKL
jgi:hypothetical protein